MLPVLAERVSCKPTEMSEEKEEGKVEEEKDVRDGRTFTILSCVSRVVVPMTIINSALVIFYTYLFILSVTSYEENKAYVKNCANMILLYLDGKDEGIILFGSISLISLLPVITTVINRSNDSTGRRVPLSVLSSAQKSGWSALLVHRRGVRQREEEAASLGPLLLRPPGLHVP
jgi:hypothetical protein